MFTQSIKSRVIKAMKRKIQIAEKTFKEEMKTINDRCSQAVRAAEIRKSQEESDVADRLVKEIIG